MAHKRETAPEESKFSRNSWESFRLLNNTGKRLMAKCRLLYQENEELGKIISSGRTAKLEGDLALQKSFSEEMKKSQSELDEFLLELDEDVEGMQSTIYYLQQQLREAKDQLLQLQQDKQKLSAIPNGSPENHRILGPDDTGDADSQFSQGQLTSGKDKLSNDSIASLSNDLNGTESLSDPITDKGSNSQQPWTPPPEKEADTNSQDVKMFVFDSAATRAAKKDTSHDLPTNVASEGSAHSVIVENKNAVSHEKQIPLAERTNLVDGSDTSQAVPSRTSEHPLEVNKLVGDNEIPETVDAVTQNSSSKRTSEGGRGRKRTRPRTPVEVEGIKEDSLPVRKRTRRREAEAHQGTVEEKRTSLEIDTDTEVQVAQTLAYWASAKQERTEVQPDPSDSSLGNGELTKKGEDK
ncbi:Pre-mRNA-splicing regulator female-lethal(2)D, partial [Stegodyphus mimosarum]